MDEALVLSRLLQFTATFLVFGTSAFLWKMAPAELSVRLEAQLRGLLGLALVVAAVTAVAWLMLVTGSMGDGWADTVRPATLSAVLLETRFGNVWLVRLGLIAMLIVTVTFGGGYRSRDAVVASGLVVASLGLVGHAAMDAGLLAVLRAINHGAHLLSAGLWVGGLVPLALVLGARRSAKADAAVATTLWRFSGMGHVVVAVVIATGAINTWYILGGWSIDTGSTYQLLLLAKIILVMTMIVLAIINRYVFLPNMDINSAAFQQLYRSTLIEIFLGLMAIGLVSYFATLEPV
ncbi:MAG: copper homeostasis membrane protein CopD [Aestuariivirgaceae bacterium]